MKQTLASLTEKVDVLTKLLEQETAEKEELLALRDSLLKAKADLEKETSALRGEKEDLMNQVFSSASLLSLSHSQIDIAKKERQRLEDEFNDEQVKNAASIVPLNDALAEHLKVRPSLSHLLPFPFHISFSDSQRMHEWKVLLAQERHYESEKIQLLVEKEISDLSFDDQLFTLYSLPSLFSPFAKNAISFFYFHFILLSLISSLIFQRRSFVRGK